VTGWTLDSAATIAEAAALTVLLTVPIRGFAVTGNRSSGYEVLELLISKIRNKEGMMPCDGAMKLPLSLLRWNNGHDTHYVHSCVINTEKNNLHLF